MWLSEILSSTTIGLDRFKTYVSIFSIYESNYDESSQFFDESVIQMANGNLVLLPEVSAHLAVGERGSVSVHFHLFRAPSYLFFRISFPIRQAKACGHSSRISWEICGRL